MSVPTLTTVLLLAGAQTQPLAPHEIPVVVTTLEDPAEARLAIAMAGEPPETAPTGPAPLPESPPPDSPPGATSAESNQSPSASTTDPANTDTIVVTARPDVPEDPMAELNAESFEMVQEVDEAVIAPVAYTYRDTVPGPLREGLGNVLSNLREPVNFLNFLLQFKVGKALETLGRFTINSTLGLGGIIDLAEKPGINLPYRSNGFANTLGFYGVEPGPYLFLPLVGSTTVRDMVGGGLDLLVLPTAVGKPFTNPLITTPIGIVGGLNERLEIDGRLQQIREESSDPYTAIREDYLQRRQATIDALRGRTSNTDVPEPVKELQPSEN